MESWVECEKSFLESETGGEKKKGIKIADKLYDLLHSSHLLQFQYNRKSTLCKVCLICKNFQGFQGYHMNGC